MGAAEGAVKFPGGAANRSGFAPKNQWFRAEDRMLIYDSTTGGYLEGPPPKGSGAWAFMKWLFGPPKNVYPTRLPRSQERLAKLRRQVDEYNAERAAERAPCCRCPKAP